MQNLRLWTLEMKQLCNQDGSTELQWEEGCQVLVYSVDESHSGLPSIDSATDQVSPRSTVNSKSYGWSFRKGREEQ